MQYIVCRHRVIEYCTKYVTMSEPQSQPLNDVYTTIVRGLQEGNTSLKVVQKLLINTAGARDYSAQEICHLLQLPMFKASRDFIVLSLDGSRAVEITWRKNSVLLHRQLLIITCVDLLFHLSIPSRSLTLLGSTPC